MAAHYNLMLVATHYTVYDGVKDNIMKKWRAPHYATRYVAKPFGRD